MNYGYTPVSTTGHTLAAQLEQLRAAGCDKIFGEQASGVQAGRRELQELLGKLDAGDMVTVTRIGEHQDLWGISGRDGLSGSS